MLRGRALTDGERKVVEAFRRALEVARAVQECSRELPSLCSAVAGLYVEPGPSGAITRGKFDVLPTGRNFYAVDPRALPTPAAWRVGVRAAEELLRRHLEVHGRYPETVGFVLWSIDAYKADGEQLSQILHLLGVEPVWGSDGVVKGLRVVPLEELGRPRIDCLVRISGIVRDTLPNYVYMIDEAVEKVALLDEPPRENYVRKHYLEHVEKLKGLVERPEEAALYRVFCAPPGAYGAGVNLAVEASAWRDREDLAKVWVQWSGYAYGRRGYGVKAHAALIEALKTVEVVTREHVSDEHDVLGCCCYFAYHAGFCNAARQASGKDVDAVQVDSRDISNIRVVDMKTEVERVARAKLLNPTWVGGMMKHGYSGASEIARKVLHLYGWGATGGLVEDWVYSELAKYYALNPELRRWFEEHNPWALEEIVRRLLEAAERGVWKAPRELVERLREVYGELEGIMEEMACAVGEHQGGAVSIYAPGDDEHWASRIREVEELWARLRRGG